MKLSLGQIKSVAFGAQEIALQADGGISFRRLKDTQVAAFTAMSETFTSRALATTGCRLDFHTDSRHVCVQTMGEGKYEILVNGLCAAVVQGGMRPTVALPEGDTRVTILLPDHKAGMLKLVFLDEGSYVRPHVYDRKFLFLGDSITQGASSSRPSTTYANRISQFFNAQVMNWGLGGSYFNPATLASVDYDPDVIFLAYGTNDYNHFHSLEELEATSIAYMDRIGQLFPGKPVFYISPLWRADGELVRATGTHRQVCDRVIAHAISHGFHHIEGYDLVPHMEDYYADAFLHPNDLGFSLYSENLIWALKDKL